MGMFDNITCDYPLPLPLEVIDVLPDIYDGVEFQTKSFDCYLGSFIINENGILLEDRKEYEWKDDDSYFLKGYMEAISSKIEETKFHGIVDFYCYERILDNNDKSKGIDVSVDYNCKFSDGKIESIDLIDFSISDASEDIRKLENFFEKVKIENNKWYRKFFSNTKLFKSLKSLIIKLLYKLENLINKIRFFIIKYF